MQNEMRMTTGNLKLSVALGKFSMNELAKCANHRAVAVALV